MTKKERYEYNKKYYPKYNRNISKKQRKIYNDRSYKNNHKEHLLASKRWRLSNREKYLKQAREYGKQRALKIQLFVQQCKKIGCKICGEQDIACLDFHHRNQAEKEGNISVLKFRKVSIEKIQIEINKCDILCSNCHRKLHYYNNSQSRTDG